MRWFTCFGVIAFVLLQARVESRGYVPKGVIQGSGKTVGYGELHEEWRGEVIQLAWSPRAFLLKGLLNDEECDHLRKLAEPSMQKSTVVDNDTGRSVPSNIRTSSGTFLEMQQDEVVSRIEKRVAQVTMIPVEHQEGFQILNYVDGQKYEPHWDYFHDDFNKQPQFGGQRIITVLMYLTTVEEGGETVFPNAEKRVSGPEWSECARNGMSVKTFKGDAIMFYSLKPDGTEDPASLHGSCPTLKGEKWSATKWIHVLPFQLGSAYQKEKWSPKDKSGCSDLDNECADWARMGECEHNPNYMNAYCMKSCGKCGTATS